MCSRGIRKLLLYNVFSHFKGTVLESSLTTQLIAVKINSEKYEQSRYHQQGTRSPWHN